MVDERQTERALSSLAKSIFVMTLQMTVMEQRIEILESKLRGKENENKKTTRSY